MTELYALTRNTNADELREKLKTAPREDIEAALFNEHYNKFCYMQTLTIEETETE